MLLARSCLASLLPSSLLPAPSPPSLLLAPSFPRLSFLASLLPSSLLPAPSPRSLLLVPYLGVCSGVGSGIGSSVGSGIGPGDGCDKTAYFAPFSTPQGRPRAAQSPPGSNVLGARLPECCLLAGRFWGRMPTGDPASELLVGFSLGSVLACR